MITSKTLANREAPKTSGIKHCSRSQLGSGLMMVSSGRKQGLLLAPHDTHPRSLNWELCGPKYLQCPGSELLAWRIQSNTRKSGRWKLVHCGIMEIRGDDFSLAGSSSVIKCTCIPESKRQGKSCSDQKVESSQGAKKKSYDRTALQLRTRTVPSPPLSRFPRHVLVCTHESITKPSESVLEDWEEISQAELD